MFLLIFNDIFDYVMITVVTAYYQISSKYPSDKYLEWIKKFFQLPCNLYIFSDKNSIETLKQIRNNSNNTYYHELEISDFYTNKYKDLWEHSYKIDPERINGLNHTPELYMIWAEKPFLVKKAIENNIFNSEIFCWTDIGVIRNNDMFPKVLNFPNNLCSQLNPNKIMFSMIEPFLFKDCSINELGIAKCFENMSVYCGCYPVVRIQGGFFAGFKEKLLKYADLYSKELEIFEKTKTYGGKDQYIMGNILLKNIDFFQIIHDEKKYYHNEFFGFLIRFS